MTTTLKKKANQYTDEEFLAWLIKTHRNKKNKNRNVFTYNDVNQYCIKGCLPKCYGGTKISIEKVGGKIRLITILKS